jgi:8-oxo-dGTP pyrophosphatase MutT (NUDIX family)
MSENFEQKWTCIFLIDKKPPAEILMLKRGSDRKLAPDMWTGLGGKVEKEESNFAGAVRELKEEADEACDVSLKEFGRLIINKQKSIHYFFGILEAQPAPKCTEGTLEWVEVSKVLEKDIIPSTKIFLQEWQKRNWNISPFTILLERADVDDVKSQILSYDIKERLV